MGMWDSFTNAVGTVKEGLERGTDISTYPQAISMLVDTLKGQDVQDIIPHISFEDRFMEGLQKFHEKGQSDPTQLAMDFMPGGIGVIHPNYRSVDQIQALRKMMAEEMRSRGSIPTKWQNTSPYNVEDVYGIAAKNIREQPHTQEFIQSTLNAVSDPIDQILRGSWYHGLSGEARDRIMSRQDSPIWKYIPYRATEHTPEWIAELDRNVHARIPSREEWRLSQVAELGFPLSLHDAQSISNKLGEPAGISLSMLPTTSQKFAADEYIHRVLPRFGGSPTKRIVNLMEQGGRDTLNDAYDVVANSYISPHGLGSKVNTYADRIADPTRNIDYRLLEDMIGEHATSGVSTGPFNQQLSTQLQQMGKRGILYNPRRWDEYEMLMLDPKYALPLDYRMFQEYANPNWSRAKGAYNQSGGLDVVSATPGIQKGLSQIQDLMAQNKSRLGDIYSERPWTKRLNEENKRSLLEMIDPQYREQVGNQLFQP